MKPLILTTILLMAILFVNTTIAQTKQQPKPSMNLKNDKLSIYQVMMHLWGNTNSTRKFNGSLAENGVGKFSDFNEKSLPELKKFGYSHIYFTGIIRHATTEDFSTYGIPREHPENVKGRCGAPFALTDYYDVNPFLANDPSKRMEEFEAMIERCHSNGLKAVIDCIPNHVAREYRSIARPKGVKDFGENDDKNIVFSAQNNFYYLPNKAYVAPQSINTQNLKLSYEEYPAKATGNDVFSERPSVDDWFETVKLNYGVDYQQGRTKHFSPTPSTWLKMREMLLYWAAKGVDGFRCDMAEMVPVEFWGWVIPEVKKVKPDVVFIAEIYNPKEYHNYIHTGKFDYLYDKVGLYDALRRLMEGKPEATAMDITRCWQQESGDISGNMLRFLENHDEQRIASDFFAQDPWAAIPAMTVAATLHTGPVMLYFGQEVGEKGMDVEGFGQKDGRTTMFDFWQVEEHAKWVNGGKFDGGKLSDYQQQLRSFYSNLLHFATENEAVSQGHFYDLQYANTYDKHMVYSYIRYTNKQKLLFICHFDRNQTRTANVYIPKEAFGTLGLNIGKTYTLKDLSGTSKTQKITANELMQKGIGVELPPLAVHIFEIE